ncbi:MAG: DegT/DnrJ/EryC1/StrS family aminotransferase [Candidatus Omnitrophica bacterium]|nr:DegT/DnrJ/EryC1/StrS family aminotransferase [Candidatus Omnitrophota bacterium]
MRTNTENTKLSFGTMSVTAKAKQLVTEAMDSGMLSQGKYVREFEERFADLVGVKEAVAVSTGTEADTLALAVLYDFGAKRGDEVIIPALSFVATGNAVLHAGFKPVFVDIQRETLNINPDEIEAAITKKTKAIMPVHLMGKPAEMDRIIEIAKKHNLCVVEDAAEAHGAVYKGKNIGAWGDMAAYSLYAAHIISTIEGGIVVTDRKDFAEVLRSLRSHGRFCKCKQCVLNVGKGECLKRFKGNKDQRFDFERIGYSSKMNELEAAVGLGNLDIYQDIFKKRRENLIYLIGQFSRFAPYLFTINEEDHETVGPHAFPVIVGEDTGFSRDELVFYLKSKGIDSRNLFLSMPTQCRGFEFLGYKLGEFPNAEYIADNGFHIGVHQGLGRRELEYFVEGTKQFLDRR